jgi:hypothetical protein
MGKEREMTDFKEGDEVAWIVKYIKHETSHAAVHDGVSIQLETSPGNKFLVHNPKLYPVSAVDVNGHLKQQLENELYLFNFRFDMMKKIIRNNEDLLYMLRQCHAEIEYARKPELMPYSTSTAEELEIILKKSV